MTHVNCNKLYAHTYTNGITPRKNTKKATERVRKKRVKTIIKIRAEINEIENGKTTEKIQ
jgi:hypothetical protein